MSYPRLTADRALAAALLRRETGRAFPLVLVGIAVLAAFVGVRTVGISRSDGASISILARFDRTIAAVLAIIALFRVIDRIAHDAESDWMLQLCAVRASRQNYLVLQTLSTAVGLSVLSVVASSAFALGAAVGSRELDVALQVMLDLPLCTLMILSASAFGAATSLIFGARFANGAATAFLIAPWIVLWHQLATKFAAPGYPLVLRVAGAIPPRLFIAHTPAHLAFVLFHAGVAMSIALALSERCIGRRP